MASPNPGSVVTYNISINSSAIPDTYEVYSIRVEQAVNRIATATIVLLDGDPASETFAISESATFVPGNEVTIELGYDANNTVLFQGIVTKQAIRINNASGPTLEVECKDKAVQMTVGRKNCTWQNSADSDAISTLIANAGLSSSVAATAVTIPSLVQYDATDWDFMLSRAEVNRMVVSTINNKVSVFNPTSDTSPALTLTYGMDLIDFHAEINALTQLSKVTASSWDVQNQQLISAEASNELPGPGNLSSAQLSGVAHLSNFELQTSAAESKDALTAWAKSQMLKSALSKIIGNARFQGDPILVPGKYLTLAGVGARFNGDHFVSAVRHEIANGNWITEADIGLSPTWFNQAHQIEAPPAAGLLPGVGGLFNATVKKIDSDPENEYRILVDVALFNDKGTGLWARMSNFYSTNGRGAFFLPEVGDEVILGFLNQDPRYPVILGSLYSQKNKPNAAFTPNATNNMKGIVTKSGLRIMFDDDNKILTLITADNNTLELSDKDKQISIKDENGNSIVMSSTGIAIKSDQSISLEAAQGVRIKGDTGITIESSGGDVSTKGLNIKNTADIQYTAKGNAEVSVEGGGMLTLKAAMVMIN